MIDEGNMRVFVLPCLLGYPTPMPTLRVFYENNLNFLHINLDDLLFQIMHLVDITCYILTRHL